MGSTTKKIDPRGVYGAPELILIGENPRWKYPPEVDACALLYNPRDTRFTPAPSRDGLWCCDCHRLRPRLKFLGTKATAGLVCVDCQAIRDKGVWCSGCREWLPRTAFHRHRNRPNGYQSFCIDCQKAHRKSSKRLKHPLPVTPMGDRWYRG